MCIYRLVSRLKEARGNDEGVGLGGFLVGSSRAGSGGIQEAVGDDLEQLIFGNWAPARQLIGVSSRACVLFVVACFRLFRAEWRRRVHECAKIGDV